MSVSVSGLAVTLTEMLICGCGVLLQRARRVRILEREILDVLRQDHELRAPDWCARGFGRAAVGGAHVNSPSNGDCLSGAIAAVANTALRTPDKNAAAAMRDSVAVAVRLDRFGSSRSGTCCHSPGARSMTERSPGSRRRTQRRKVAAAPAAHRADQQRRARSGR